MLHSTFFSAGFCFLLICTITHITSINALSRDIVSETCRRCANRTTNYDFCLTSLQPVTISHFTNLQGLAVITMELSLKNATTSILTIRSMSRKEYNPFVKECLRDCFELYLDGVSMLVDSAEAFFRGRYYVAESLMSGVMDMTDMCEQGFKEKGEVTVLTTENYNLFHLSDIAVCIINLLFKGSGWITPQHNNMGL